MLPPLWSSQYAVTVYSWLPVTLKLKFSCKAFTAAASILRNVEVTTKPVSIVTGLMSENWFQMVAPPKRMSCSQRPVACGQVTSRRTRRRATPLLLVNCQNTSLTPPAGTPMPATHTNWRLRVSVRVTLLATAEMTLGVKTLVTVFQGDMAADWTVKKAWPVPGSVVVLSGLIVSRPPREEDRLTGTLPSGSPHSSRAVTTNCAMEVPSA